MKKNIHLSIYLRFIFCVLSINYLTACTGLSGEVLPSVTQPPSFTLNPSSTPGASVTAAFETPESTSTAMVTRTPRPTKPTNTATPTQIPNSVILSDFPMALNTVWKYSAKISYQRPGSVDQLDEWSGEITRKVTGVHESDAGEMVFSVDVEIEPAPPDTVWQQPRTEEYVLINGGIIRDGDRIYQWPLAGGRFWKAWPSGEYNWSVSDIKSVVTPFRTFENCYLLILVTNPDSTGEVFCPGIGFVARDYWHHGDPQIEHWELIDFQK